MEQKPLDKILADRHEMPQLVPGKLLGHIPGLVSLEGNQDTIYVKNEPQVPQAHMGHCWRRSSAIEALGAGAMSSDLYSQATGGSRMQRQ